VRSSCQRNLLKAREAFSRAKSSSWYGWASDKYWYLSDKLSAAAHRSRFWSAVSATLRVNPSNLALGFAEGTILYKFTFLLHAPLELWLIVKLFKQQRRVLAAAEGPGRPEAAEAEEAAGGKGAGGGWEDIYTGYLAHAIPWMEPVLAATRDAEFLAHVMEWHAPE